MSGSFEPSAPLVAGYDGLIVDADGVLYRGAEPVDFAGASLERARSELDRPWCVVTNNAAHAPEHVAAHLRSMGIGIDAEHVITSPEGAVEYLRSSGTRPGSAVFVVGGPGIDAALQAGGFAPVRDRHADPVAVVQGFGPDLRWADLAEAAYAIEAGALWVATNADLTLPTAEGLAPGNGSMVQAVGNAVGRGPDAVTGKPEPLLMQVAAKRLGLKRPLVVGDRIDTDIRGGNRAGMDTLLVLTGVTGDAELERLHGAPVEDRPTYLARDLRALLEPASCSVIIESADEQADEQAENQADAGTGERGDTDPLAGLRRSLARAWAH